MSETSPRRLDEHLPRIRRELSGASRLLVCLDFDGTLAPIVEEPTDAAALEANERGLETLASEPQVSTAIVSGRALSDVRTRVGGADVYAGNHGLELERDGSVAVHPIARTRAALVDEVCSALETVLEPIPRTRIENKRLTGTVHTRSVPAALRPVVGRLAERIVDRIGGGDLVLSSGKRVLEVGPAIPWGKGNAVELIASDLPAETASVYVGDDVTDESAFQAVEPAGIGVRVGDSRPSAASYRVRSPEHVAEFLEWLDSEVLDAIGRPIDPGSDTLVTTAAGSPAPIERRSSSQADD
ncbi:trehalose-phosphatase [Natrarchaeobius oligotrophus]|uniref:Trehalose 6-phosphate phosphatase n=1 Tax=Natrarchaeobius chitinivorans TaxID=1679083 RepID=A0A3N6MRK7_NATCH|nr:trehalose-phosphatase [Natrarchaeobius chitinivorans]RQH00391.1 trehalose-phosphatase [Natrarchaeobius chitinivorans]